MTDDYIPTTEDIRRAYATEFSGFYIEEDAQAFDRWLAKEKADALRDFRQGLIENQMAHYGIVLPDIGEIVDALDECADYIEGEA